MNTFLTSDSHIGHRRILEYCNRPFPSIEAHDEALIRNWNAKVRKDSEVFHLGDFMFGSWKLEAGRWTSTTAELQDDYLYHWRPR